MDRIRIVGGTAAQRHHSDFRREGRHLPLMIASLLTDATLHPRPRATARRRRLLRRILGDHGVDVMVSGKRPGETTDHGQTHARFSRRHRRHHRALRARLGDARELLGHRPTARPCGQARMLAARRLRHRHAAGRSVHHGDGSWARGSTSTAAMSSRARRSGLRRRDSVSRRSRSADHTTLMAAIAGARHDSDRERRAGARDRRRRRLPRRMGAQIRRIGTHG